MVKKIIFNFCIGKEEVLLAACRSLCLTLFKQEPTKTLSKTISKEFKIKKGVQLGWKVTLRNQEKIALFLQRFFEAKQKKVYSHCFYKNTFSLGLASHLDLKLSDYEPKIGSFGFDLSVVFKTRSFSLISSFLNKQFGVELL